MKRAARTKSGPKPKAAPVGRPGASDSGLDGFAKRINALFSANPIEAATALERLAHVCMRWVLEEDMCRERNRLICRCERLARGSDEYNQIQAQLSAIAARGIDWDPTRSPLMLLERRLRELTAAQLELSKTPSAMECWNVVAPIAVLLNEHLEGLPGELAPWSDGVCEARWCRLRVRTNLESTPSVAHGLVSSCQFALEYLQSRDDARRAVDSLESPRGLRSLLIALSFLRAELLEPGRHLPPAVWSAVLAHARERSRTMGEHWPAGACEPVALKARDDVGSRLGLALALLSQPGRARDQRHAEALDEGIALLDQYVGPVCKWKPLPLPVVHVDPVRSATGQTNPPPPVETLKLGAWFSQAVREFGPGLVELKPSDLSRKNVELGARRGPSDRGPWLYLIDRVVSHPSFSSYKAAIIKARDEDMPLKRGKPRGPQAKKQAR